MLRRHYCIFAVFCLLALAGCGGVERDPAIGEAFGGPPTHPIRQDLGVRSDVVAQIKHGERVEILAKRRRMLKVRTAAGVEGWIDSRQLLSARDMEEVTRLNDRTRAMAAQAQATVEEPLNVHTVPNRQAPSLFQIEPRKPVDVLGGVRAPRVNYEARLELRSLAPQAPSPRKKPRNSVVAPPPPGPPPPLIANWLALSGNPQLKPRPAAKPAAPAPSPTESPLDDWSLVRDASGRSGWVLTRLLFLSVPEEVAQYGERARIVAFFRLPGTTPRGGKPACLWATLSHGGEDYQFDSVRLFSFNTRRKRYETAFIERNLEGYLPLEVTPAPSFAFVVQAANGQFVRRKYALPGSRPRLVEKRTVEPPGPLWQPSEPGPDPEKTPDTPEREKSFTQRVRDWFAGIRARFR